MAPTPTKATAEAQQPLGDDSDRAAPTAGKGSNGGRQAKTGGVAAAPAAGTKSSAADKNSDDVKASARQARIEKNLQDALLGVSKLNIAKPDGPKAKLEWGSVNNRALNESHVAGLARSIRDGKQASRYPIYAAVPRTHIQLKSLSRKGGSFTELKEVEYTEEGLGKSVKMLSGHHRQQAVEHLQDEYEKNCDKARNEAARMQKQIDKKQGKSSARSTAEQLDEMQVQIEKLVTLAKENGLWEVEWYDDNILSTEARSYLSENADFPTMPANDQEKAHMLMWMVKCVAVQVMTANQLKAPPVPGSVHWEKGVLKNAVTATQAKNGSINFLIKHRVQYEMYSMALEYPYFCDASNLSIQQLSSAMQTPANRKLKDVKTLGTFWAWMMRQGLMQMNLVANRRKFPSPEDPQDPHSVCLRNVLAQLKNDDKNIFITARAWASTNSVMGEQGATDMQRAKALAYTKEFIDVEYKDFESEMTTIDKQFFSHVFNTDALTAVDIIYHTVFGEWNEEERSVEFLDSSSTAFRAKMVLYNKAVTQTLKRIWQDRRLAGKATMSDDDYNTYEVAEMKLDWIMQLRKAGYYPNIPFPTKTFIQDSLDRLDAASMGFQALCRAVDPLCDSVIRRTTESGTGDVWDYTGYMLYYLSGQNSLQLFRPAANMEHLLCSWILHHMRLLDQTSAVFLSYADDTVHQFISMSNANWLDPMKPQNMAKGPEDTPPAKGRSGKRAAPATRHAPPGSQQKSLPPLLQRDFPHMEWTPEYISMTAEMSQVIAGLMSSSGSNRADPGQKKGKAAGKKTTKGGAAARHQGVCTASQNDVVARALPEIWLQDAEKNKPLYMLFRHAFDWRTLDLRSIPDKAWSYAYRLIFAWHCHQVTWGCMLNHAACRSLRSDFSLLLSQHAHPFATIAIDAQPGDSPLASSSDISGTVAWAYWDNNLLDGITKKASQLGLLGDGPSVLPPKYVLASAKRWARYEGEVQKIISTICDCLCAQDGNWAELPLKVSDRRLDPAVACVVEDLLVVLGCNADRLEHRELTESKTDPWVAPGNIGLRECFLVPVPTGESDEHAYLHLTDFGKRDRARFDRFIRGLECHGYPVKDVKEFLHMERDRPKCELDGPSTLMNPRRRGPILPQDVSWREKWATEAPSEDSEENYDLPASGAAPAEMVERHGGGAAGDQPIVPRPNPHKAGSDGGPSLSAPRTGTESGILQRLSGLPGAQDGDCVPRAGRAVSVTAVTREPESSPPPPNQAALKAKKAKAAKVRSDKAEPADNARPGSPFDSALGALASHSTDMKQTTNDITLPVDRGLQPSSPATADDLFSHSDVMDIDQCDAPPSPTQLVDALDRPRIRGTEWPAHCWGALEEFGRMRRQGRTGAQMAQKWRDVWTAAGVANSDDPIPKPVLKYALSLSGRVVDVDGLTTSLGSVNGPEKLLRECEHDQFAGGYGHNEQNRAAPSGQGTRRGASKKTVQVPDKRTYDEVGLSLQPSPRANRESKRVRHHPGSDNVDINAEVGGEADADGDSVCDDDEDGIYTIGTGRALPPPGPAGSR